MTFEIRSEPSIFLCHSHRDKEFARKLARDLSELTIQVWFDEWELQPGDSLHECIGKALVESAFIAVLLTPDSVSSNWCKSELQQGLAAEKRLNRKIVLPLLCKSVQPPPFLEDRLFVNLDADYWRGLAELAGFVKNVDLRLLRAEMERTQLRCGEDVLKIIEACGIDILKYMTAQDYTRLQELLRKYGIHVPTGRLQIIPKRSKDDDDDSSLRASIVQY